MTVIRLEIKIDNETLAAACCEYACRNCETTPRERITADIVGKELMELLKKHAPNNMVLRSEDAGFPLTGTDRN